MTDATALQPGSESLLAVPIPQAQNMTLSWPARAGLHSPPRP